MARERVAKNVEVPNKLLSLLARVEDVFRYAAIADEEIERMCVGRKMHEKKLLLDSFLKLRPPRLFFGKDVRVYRHHCRELLGRVLSKFLLPLNLGTDAEVMLALSETLLAAPLQQDAAALYSRLYQKIFGDLDLRYDIAESYQGAADELLSTMRTKVSARWRK